jgi:hypothetical protein
MSDGSVALGGSLPPGAGWSYSGTENIGAASTTAAVGRGGPATGAELGGGTSNTGATAGISVVGSNTFVMKVIDGQNVRVAQYEGSNYLTAVAPILAQPLADFTWPCGRHEFHAVAHWDVAPGANVDSGLALYQSLHNRVMAGSFMTPGILIGNHAGVLQLVTRGNGRYEEVDLSAFAGPLNSWNKIGLIIRSATKAVPASVTAMVNDRVAAVRQWTGAHALPTVIGASGAMNWHIVHAEQVTYLNLRDWVVAWGADVLGNRPL